MKKAIAAFLVLMMPVLLLCSCGNGPSSARTQETSESVGTRDMLLDAFYKKGYPLQSSPLKSAGFGGYREIDPAPAGAYSLIFSDTDGDGAEELIALCISAEEYISGGYCYQLRVLGFDADENGVCVSDELMPTRISTSCVGDRLLCENYVLVSDGSIELLHVLYDEGTDHYSYGLYSFCEGRFLKVVTYRFDKDFYYEALDGDYLPGVSVYQSSLREDVPYAAEYDESLIFEGPIGAQEVEAALGKIRDDIRGKGFADGLFPVSSSGEPIGTDVFDKTCSFRFKLIYDEQNTIYGYFEDRTKTFENYS